MLARDATITVLDFETTGVVGDAAAEPWQIGLVCVVQGVVAAESAWESLIRTGERPFNRHAPGRWQELRDEIRQAPTMAELYPQVRQRLAAGLVAAHNTGTERTLLEQHLPLHRSMLWLDTLPLARLAWPGLTSYALTDLTAVLGLTDRVTASCPGRGAHDALYDAFASAWVLQTLLQAPGWEQVTLASLAHFSAPNRVPAGYG